MTRLLLVTAVLAHVGCGKDSKKSNVDNNNPPTATDATAAAKPPTEAKCAAGKVTTSVANRYECSVDGDCTPTCGWGAINYRALVLLDDTCEDGCASDGMTAKCVESKCTTFSEAGKTIPSCNDIAAPEDVCVDKARADLANQCEANEKLVPTHNRFACASDDDCVTSCKYGALNREGYDLLGAVCKGGCSGKGMHAKCVASRCVAFGGDDKRVDSCTEKPAPEAICVAK